MMPSKAGFSLLELLITIAIIAIILTLGLPAVLSAHKSMQLKGAVEVSYFALQKARSIAISKRTDIMVIFDSSFDWCIALSDVGICDCKIPLDCTIDGVESNVQSADFSLVVLQDVTFGNDDAAIFDGVRGLAIGSAGSAIFAQGNNHAKLILSNMGRVRICVQSGQIGGYEPC